MKNSIVELIDWLILVLLWIREDVSPSPAVQAVYQGGVAILPELEVLKVQPGLIAVFGEKKAMILQKVHEWLMTNQKKGSHQWKGSTWTYGSYGFWIDKHFAWFTRGYFGKLIRDLEAEGVLISSDNAPFCRSGEKAYTLNYDRIKFLVGGKKSIEGWQKVDQGVVKSRSGGDKKSIGGCQKVDTNNIKDNDLPQTNEPKQSTSTPTERARRRWTRDGGVDVRPDHDSGEYSFGGESVTDTQADFESSADFPVDAVTHLSVVEDVVETPPSSAAPPSVVEGLMRDMPGLMAWTAETMVKVHGETRCRAVANYVVGHREQIHNPPGFWIMELQRNQMRIPDDYAAPRSVAYAGQYADLIES